MAAVPIRLSCGSFCDYIHVYNKEDISLIKIDYIENVASLVLNRAKKRNALTRDLLRELDWYPPTFMTSGMRELHLAFIALRGLDES